MLHPPDDQLATAIGPKSLVDIFVAATAAELGVSIAQVKIASIIRVVRVEQCTVERATAVCLVRGAIVAERRDTLAVIFQRSRRVGVCYTASLFAFR